MLAVACLRRGGRIGQRGQTNAGNSGRGNQPDAASMTVGHDTPSRRRLDLLCLTVIACAVPRRAGERQMNTTYHVVGAFVRALALRASARSQNARRTGQMIAPSSSTAAPVTIDARGRLAASV